MSKHFLTFRQAADGRPVYLDPDAVEAVTSDKTVNARVFTVSGLDCLIEGSALVVMGEIAAARTGGGTGERRAAPPPAPAPEPPPKLEGWPFTIGSLPPESVFNLPISAVLRALVGMGETAAARTGQRFRTQRATDPPNDRSHDPTIPPAPEPPPELAQELADVVGTMRETAEKLKAAGGLEPMLDRLILELGDRLDRRETHTWKRFAAELAKRARAVPVGSDLSDELEALATLAETASIYGPVGDLELEAGRFGRMVAVCEAARCYSNMVRGGNALAAHLSGRLGTCWDRLQEALFVLHTYPDPGTPAQRNAQSTKPAAGGRSHTVRMEAVTLTPEQSAELAPILKRIEAEDRAADEAHPRGDLGELATILFDLNAAIPDVGKPWAQELHDGVARARAWLARTPDSLQGRAEGGSDA